MVLLDQELTYNERLTVLHTAIVFGDEYHINFRRWEARKPGEQPVPAGTQATPIQDPPVAYQPDGRLE